MARESWYIDFLDHLVSPVWTTPLPPCVIGVWLAGVAQIIFFIVIAGGRGLQMSAALAIFADETINHDKNYPYLWEEITHESLLEGKPHCSCF